MNLAPLPVGKTTVVEGKYSYSGFLTMIIKLLGLIPKVIVRSGCKAAGAIAKLGGCFLGHI
jgi:hypothetical protein